LQVKEAVKANVPFVPKSGGHSQWSTINSSGIIIDLRLWKGVEVDANQHTVKVSGGLLMKELQIALADKDQWTSEYHLKNVQHSETESS
jgi:FAD/FMN-containing dehydrogenase